MKFNAIISVFNKSGVVGLARALTERGFRIFSTGGTARVLREHDIEVTDIQTVTRFPEIFDGRVKTLHPKIFGGILARRSRSDDRETMQEHAIPAFDLVVVNLYPFEEKAGQISDFKDLMEWIDIGGPSMIRAAAKNWPDVTVLTDPADYDALIRTIDESGWPPPDEFRLRMAMKAFHHTARYDALIAHTFRQHLPQEEVETLPLALDRHLILRYGENPHQKATWYRFPGSPSPALQQATILQGKPLSYNNLLDLDTVVRVIADFEGEFDGVPAVVVKHNTPSGVALAETPAEAYRLARDADALSAFGGIAAIGAIVDAPTAEAVVETFMECLIAPGYTPEAREILARKKNLRVLELPAPWRPGSTLEMRTVLGGVLVQDGDWVAEDPSNWKVVSRREPTEDEWAALRFAWKVVKHAKSNAVLLADRRQTIGIGAGQVSRVDAVKVAIQKAHRSPEGSVAASDAFFPFRDSIDELAKAGVTAVIEPGGSIRDEEVIEAANEHNLALVFTGVRHFRH